MSVRADFAVFAEDLRREDNGKILAIGIFGAEAIISSLPAQLSLAFLIGGSTERTSEKVIGDIILRAESGQVHLRGEVESEPLGLLPVDPDGRQRFFLSTPKLPILLSEPGMLELLIGFNGAEPEVISRLHVRAGEVPNLAQA